MEKLKPCPFCGGEAKVSRTIDGQNDPCFLSICNTSGCYAVLVAKETEEEAIEAWNTRHVDSLPTEVSNHICSCNTLNYGYGYAKCFDCGKLKIINNEAGHTL